MRINRGGGVGKGEERRPETRKECREEGKGKRKEKKVRCFCVMIPLFCFTYIQQGFFLLETCFKHWWYFMGMIYTGKNSAARVFFCFSPKILFFLPSYFTLLIRDYLRGEKKQGCCTYVAEKEADFAYFLFSHPNIGAGSWDLRDPLLVCPRRKKKDSDTQMISRIFPEIVICLDCV